MLKINTLKHFIKKIKLIKQAKIKKNYISSSLGYFLTYLNFITNYFVEIIQ